MTTRTRYLCFMHTSYYLGLLFLVLSIYSNAQEPEALRKSLFKYQGKEKVEKYLDLGILYFEKHGQSDSLLFYANKAYDLSKQHLTEAAAKRLVLYKPKWMILNLSLI